MKLYLTESQYDRLISEMTGKEVDKAASEADRHPSEAQIEAGNYKKGHVRVKGFPISIENPKGSKRGGTDENGKKWEVTMKNHYGYFRLNDGQGKDGDAIDVFIGPKPKSFEVAYVVDQKNKKGEFDESKVMFGFMSEKEAKRAYMSNYSPGWDGFMAITEVDLETFKKWLYDGHRQRKPFSEYKKLV